MNMQAHTLPTSANPLHKPFGRGFLELGFELDRSGRSILRDWERRAPIIVQQALYFDEAMPEMPCVYILSSGGPVIEGDRSEQNFTVRRNAYAHISTGAATKIAEMNGGEAEMRQRFNLEEGAYLEFLPEQTIPCRNARYTCRTEITAAPGATLFYSEIFTSGRKYSGETFCYDRLDICTEASRPSGERLFRERFVIEPALYPTGSKGIMNGCDVFANAVVLTPEKLAERIYEATDASVDAATGTAAGITRLPNNSGLIFKVLGSETEPVKQRIREFCSTVRLAVKGRTLPNEFPWR